VALLILFALLAIPLIEIGLFITVGGALGLVPTLMLVVLTAVLGTILLRAQGLAVLRRAQDQMRQGTPPVREVFDGACLLVAGALLLTPGFLTDALGAALLLPPVRTWLGRMMMRHIVVQQASRHQTARPDIIDGDFEVLDRPDEPPT
jgi:UPF0716 protein FxsA